MGAIHEVSGPAADPPSNLNLKTDFVDKISTFLHGFTLQPTSLEY